VKKDTKILSEKEVEKILSRLHGWIYKDNKISKKFKFDDFLDSVDFINKLTPFCQELDHHPDVHIFYNKILFDLQRFDVGGKVTNKDVLVANKIEELYRSKLKNL